MNYAVITIPDFSLHALRRSEPDLARKPVALIEGEGRKAVLVQVSPEALGVERGLVVSLAMARCPGIVLRTRDLKAETDSHRLLVAAAFSLSPRVEITGPECCTVDLQGANPEQTERTMRQGVADLMRMGLPARAGAAATPLLAHYAARCAEPVLVVRAAREFLHDLPLSFAEPTAVQSEVLAAWGIRTLGQLATLPKAEVGQRLGTEGAALWERAAGETSRPLRLTQPTQTFASAWDYEPGIDNIEPLFFKLRRYAECLAFELRSAGFVAESLALTLLLEDETDYWREYQLPEPNTDVESWLKVMHSQLESLTLPARVVTVQFVAKPTRPLVKQEGLFDTGLRDPHAFWENLAKVSAILGEERVGTPVMQNTWRPDSFTLERPAESVPAPEPAPIHPPQGGVLRRFRPPKSVLVMMENSRPSGISGYASGAVQAAAGPWRNSGGWWRPDRWVVETWHVEMDTGEIFQLARTAEGWAIEGVID